MPLWLLNIASNKFVWIGAAFMAIIVYHNITMMSLETQFTQLKIDKAEVDLSLKTAKANLTKTLEVNDEKQEELEKIRKDLAGLQKLNDIIISGKNSEIKQLKKLISESTEEVVYSDEAQFENITIKIKEVPDENDTTFNILNSIGS